MSGKTFRSISKGRQDVLEESVDVEHGLLSKLEATRQPHVARMLTHEGLHTFGMLLIIHCAAIVCHHN